MAKDHRDNDASASSAQAGQSKRPPLHHHVSHDSDSQVSDHTSSHSHHRPKHLKHIVGGGRSHPRIPSSKALHKHHHSFSSTAKTTRRHQSPSPERSEVPERPPMLSSAHRRTTSDVRLSRDSSATNLKKNSSHTALKRNRSHVEVGKKAKSGTNIKRSSSHKEVSKLKGGKSSVHFDLGNDGQEDEWVDASGSASPYLSRRGSVISSGQSSAKPEGETSRPETPRQSSPAVPTKVQSHGEGKHTPDRERNQHKEYLTSRLLQRTPSHGAPPKMTTDTVSVQSHSGSPESELSRTSSTVYSSPKPANALGGHANDAPTSRFVDGPGSGVNPETGSFFSPRVNRERVRRPQSLGNLHKHSRDSIASEPDEEDDSALAPRTKRSQYRAAPADMSRVQQKLNLQRASSSMEPAPAGTGVGSIGVSPLVGGDDRDPRIGKLLERTGMEYLVVRRYQNPIARSINRLHQLPGAHQGQHISKQNGGINGTTHAKKPSYGLNANFAEAQRSRPVTPRRSTSMRTNGANTSFGADENGHHASRLSGSSYLDGTDDGLAALLRSMWDRNLDLSASQD